MPNTHPFVIEYNPATPVHQILVKRGAELMLVPGSDCSLNGSDINRILEILVNFMR